MLKNVKQEEGKDLRLYMISLICFLFARHHIPFIHSFIHSFDKQVNILYLQSNLLEGVKDIKID